MELELLQQLQLINMESEYMNERLCLHFIITVPGLLHSVALRKLLIELSTGHPTVWSPTFTENRFIEFILLKHLYNASRQYIILKSYLSLQFPTEELQKTT